MIADIRRCLWRDEKEGRREAVPIVGEQDDKYDRQWLSSLLISSST
jgi:hypothetical protein